MDHKQSSAALTRIVITPELQAGLQAAIVELVEQDGARGVVVVDQSGLILATGGTGKVLEPAVSALVAGVFKSLTALSRLLGEGEVKTFEQVGPSTLTVMNLLDTGDALVASFSPLKPAKEVGGALNLAIAKISPLLLAARSKPPGAGLKLGTDSISDALDQF